MSITLKEKVAIVTGGGRGIGEGIATVFAKEGATVVVANRSSDEGEAVVEEIKGAGGAAVFVQTDVRDPASVDGLVKATLDAYGRLDILCHNAGIYPDMLIEDMPVEVWNDTLNTNLTSAFLLTKACVAPMKERRFGRIIITSSITGPSVAMATLVAYGASKGGVNAFVKGAALEFACYGITVNCVCPGNILIPNVIKLYGQEAVDEMKEIIPTGALGEPADIAYAMVYLASDQAKFITGQAITVDGGQILPENPDAFTKLT
jgi:3-oxoacyl-[acyl-carrier protein] reductase